MKLWKDKKRSEEDDRKRRRAQSWMGLRRRYSARTGVWESPRGGVVVEE